MSIEKRKYPEINKYSEYNQANKNIEELTLKYLWKYSKNKKLLEELAKFETKKWLKEFKEYISNLEKKENFENAKNINLEDLFNDLKKLKKEIAQLTKKNLDSLKNNIKKETFSPNTNYDLANNIKKKFPSLYSKIINPKNFIDNSIWASLWLANSLYKIWISTKKISLDLIKLLTFKTSLKEIKELYKKV